MNPDAATPADAGAPAAADATAAQNPSLVAPALPETPEASDVPAPAAPAADTHTPAPAGVDESQLNADNAAIVAKSGKYLIGFEKLEQARERAQAAEAREAQLLQELEQLRNQQGKPAGSQLSAEQEGAIKEALGLADDVDLGDFTEDDFKRAFLAERRRNESAIKHLEDQLKARVDAILKPIREQQAAASLEEHQKIILEAHADAYEIAQSLELKQWVESKPAYMRLAIEQVLAQGQATDVVQLLNDFKKETGRATPAPQDKGPADARAKAQALLDSTPPKVPNSLSQIAGGAMGANSVFEAMEQMDAAQLAERLAELTPEQREAYYARHA